MQNEAQTIKDAQNGNRAAIEAVVEQYENMAHSIAHSFKGRTPHDDKAQAAMVGLLEAIQTFDETQGATFGTWAYRQIQGAVTTECRTYRMSLQDSVNEEGETATGLHTGRELPPDVAAMVKESRERAPGKIRNILDAIERLSDRKREVLSLYFGIDCGYQRTYRDVAAMVGVSFQRVEQIVREFRATLPAVA